MIFEELKKNKLKPFQDYRSVSSAKLDGYIPKQYWNIINDYCNCDSERMVRISMNDGSISGITCCDPHCPVKMSFQLSLVFERFGYKGLGEKTCWKVIRGFMETGKPFTIADVILKGDNVVLLGDSEGMKWSEGITRIRNSKQTFGSLLYKLSFPGIGAKFEDAMQGISSLEDFSRKIKEEKFFDFFIKRGIKNLTSLYYFVTYLPEIDVLADELSDTITKSLDRILSVCMTGRMDTSFGYFSKDSYISLCIQLIDERKLENPFEIKKVESVSKAGIVIAGKNATEERTLKYRAAAEIQKKMNANGTGDRFLFSPDEFLRFLAGREVKCE